jgi:hypothetical protein
VTQLQNDGLLDPDAHMFLQGDFYQTEPDVVTTIMTQLSLKSGRTMGEQGLQRGRIGNEATSSSRHVQTDALELTQESATSHDPRVPYVSQGETRLLLEETNKGTTSPRKTFAHPLSPPSRFCSRASSMPRKIEMSL